MASADSPLPNRRPAALPHVDQRARDDGARELVLVKREQRYVFTCAAGEEAALLERLRQMARDPETEIDWLDAALLSHQLGPRLSERLRAAEPGDGGGTGSSSPPHDPTQHPKE